MTGSKLAIEKLCGEFESMLAASERDHFERVYRDLRADVADGELAHGLARLSFAGHLLSILSLSFSREAEPAKTAEAYFRLGAHLNFTILEEALNSIGGEDRWERRAANELAAELRAARLALCCAVLDGETAAPTPDVASSIEQLKHGRESRFADVARLFDELKTVQPPSLPAIHVTIRALSRLASSG